jgi:hypothetical protein
MRRRDPWEGVSGAGCDTALSARIQQRGRKALPFLREVDPKMAVELG